MQKIKCMQTKLEYMWNLLKLKFKIIWIYIKYNMGMLLKSCGVSTFL
jgi:hypothetical protein